MLISSLCFDLILPVGERRNFLDKTYFQKARSFNCLRCDCCYCWLVVLLGLRRRRRRRKIVVSTMLLMILDALWTTTAVMMRVMTVITNDNNNNEYISEALNPSSNLSPDVIVCVSFARYHLLVRHWAWNLEITGSVRYSDICPRVKSHSLPLPLSLMVSTSPSPSNGMKHRGMPSLKIQRQCKNNCSGKCLLN